MKTIISFAGALMGLVNLVSVPLSCDHKGFYSCSACQFDSCTACVDGWHLLESENGTNICVPDCSASPLFYNNPLLGQCSKCLTTASGLRCVNCHIGVCHEEVTQAQYQSSLGTHCFDGQIAVGSSCSYFCQEGQYYDFASHQCQSCHSGCRTCVGAQLNQCLSCPSGQFLSDLNPSSQIGTCVSKSQTPIGIIQLYVTNLNSVINDGKSDQSRTGGELDPFTNLMDAINKADELAAPYSGRQVTISLTPGLHFILPSTLAQGYIHNGVKDEADRDYSLTIKALDCPTPHFHYLCHGSTESVTLINKAGAYFKLTVPRRLTLSKIIFDSADSHAVCPSGTTCNCSQRRQALCQFNSTSRSFQALSDCECPLAQMSANNCVLPLPNSFIQFDYNSAVTALLSPKALIVDNCEFRHSFGTYHNLIEIPSIGANVTIKGTKFHHISSCGAVIGNIEREQIALSATSDYSKGVMSFMDRRYAAEWNRKGSDVIPSYDPLSQSELKLEQNSFSQLDFLFNDDQDGLRLEFDFTGYSHYIRANALFLFKTDIPVTIFNNAFQENRFHIGELLNTTQTQTIPPGAPYISRSGIMIQAMIYLYRINAEAQLVSNYIAHNGGTKGPVVIELQFQSPNAVSVISHNQFEYNTGIVSSAALSLFSGVNSGILATTSTFCGGYVISGNSFVGNVVMRKGGVVRHECSRSDISFLNYDVFHEYYSQSPINEEKWQDWSLMGYAFQSATKTSVFPSGDTLTYNPLVVEAVNNTFELNLRGSECSILKFDRTPFFSVRDNLFESNGDILVAGLALSLDQFVLKATGLWGVKALGSEFQVSRRGSSLPLIYGMLNVYYSIQNITALDNWIYSQQTPKEQMCATFLQTRFQASQVVALDQISMSNTQVINQKPYTSYFSLKQIQLNHTSPFLSSLSADERLSCSMLYFDLAQEKVQMSLSQISLSDQVSQSKASQSVLLSLVPFNYDSFSSTSAVGNSQILLSELQIRRIQCKTECAILKVLTDAVSLLHSSFQQIELLGGGSLLSMTISQDMSVSFINTTVSSVNATKSKALFSLEESGATAALATFGGFFVSNCVLDESLFYLQGSHLTVNMDSFTVAGLSYEQDNPTALEGLFHLNGLHTFAIQNTHLSVSSRSDIGNYFMQVDSVSQLLMRDCNFKILSESYSPMPFIDVTIPLAQNTATFSNCTFEGMRTLAEGGAISASGSGSLYLSNLSVSHNEAQSGGALFVDEQVQTFIENSRFFHNKANIIGGVLYGSHSAAIMIQNSLFSYNEAVNAGVFYLTMGANLQLLNSEFSYNSVTENSGAGLILNNEATKANYIIGCTFKHNRAMSATLYFFFAQTFIQGCYFRDNYSPTDVTGIAVAQTFLGVSNCIFENTISFLQQEYGPESTWASRPIEGFFINYFLRGFGFVRDSSFLHGIGNEGSALDFGDRCEVEVKFCTFEKNYGNKGAIYSSEATQGSISNNRFVSNLGEYADIYLSKTNNTMVVANNTVERSQGCSVMLRQSTFFLINNTFSQLSNQAGQIIAIQSNIGVTSTANKFLNSNVARVLLFRANQFTASSPSIVAYNVISNITGNSKGIGIFLEQSPNIVVQNNQFSQVSFASLGTQEEAAGIYIDSSSVNVLLDSNSFTKCKASIGGGVSFKNGRVSFANNFYALNQGNIYGPDVAAFPVALALKSYDELPQLYRNEFPARLLSERNLLSFSNIRSGGPVDGFYLVLIDQYGDVVTSSNGNLLNLSIQNLESAVYIPKAESLIEIKEKYGVYDLSGVTFSGEPGKKTKLTLTSDAIDPSLIGQNSYSFEIELGFRNCVAGEEYTDDGRCISCTSGFYSFEAPQGVMACQKCPINAECFGGAQIAPLSGYWRSSSSSLNFNSCYISSACLGSTQSDFNPQGKCFSGYQGILCAQCEVGYVRNSQFQCAKCPAQWKNILFLILILLVAILVIILLIRTTLQSMKNSRSIVSVYFKILANHFQLIILTISFELEWPAQVQTFYDITQPVANVASRVISLDCFLGTGDQEIKNIYVYLLVYLLLPIIVISGSLLFWFLYIRSNKKKALNRTITTVIILFFLLHPSLTKNVFNIFFCRNIDGVSRLIQDLEIECYTGQHFYWALVGGGLGLVLWVIGIPWVAWALLREHRNRLHNLQVKERYGFLFNGYKQRNYYWESVVMFRKVAMIFIAVFLRSLGTRIQAFTVFLLLLFFVIATVQKKPYLTRKLNNLELISLITSCITIYSGFFFLSASESDSPNFDANKDCKWLIILVSLSPEGKWLFFLIILFSNLFFLLIWSLSLVNEVRGVCRQRFPRFYLCFCLCNRTSVLQEEKRISKAFQANENVIEEIDNIMLIMKRARHKVVDRQLFVDWNKFMNFIHSSSLQIRKLNLEKPREGDQRRKSHENFRTKRLTNHPYPKDSKLDVSAEQDFDINQKSDNFEIEFQEMEQPSINTSYMTSGTDLKRQYTYQRTRLHERVNSITGLTSLNTLNDSGRLSHRNIPEEEAEKQEQRENLKQASEQGPPPGIKRNKLKEIAASLLSMPSAQSNAPSLAREEQCILGKTPSEREFERQQNQYILDFFQSKGEEGGPAVYYISEGRSARRKSIRDPSEIMDKVERKKSKKASQKYEIKRSRTSLKSDTFVKLNEGPNKKGITPANTLKSIDSEGMVKQSFHKGILHDIEMPIQCKQQIQEIKEDPYRLPEVKEVPQKQNLLKQQSGKLQHSSSAESLQSCESSEDLKMTVKRKPAYSSFRHAFKKRHSEGTEKMNLVDSFMKGLDDTPT